MKKASCAVFIDQKERMVHVEIATKEYHTGFTFSPALKNNFWICVDKAGTFESGQISLENLKNIYFMLQPLVMANIANDVEEFYEEDGEYNEG